MRRLILLFAFTSVCAAAQPAAAPNPNAATQGAVSLLNAFARCVASTQPRVADRVLAAPFLSEAQNALASEYFKGVAPCMEMASSLKDKPPVGIVGGMAEEVYLSRHGKKQLDAVIANGAAVAPRDAAEDLALCIVRANPQASRAVLDAKPTTPEESTAIAQVVPHLGTCTPAGSTMKVNKSTVRTLVAIGFYLLTERNKA
jgi:hypothetical protein